MTNSCEKNLLIASNPDINTIFKQAIRKDYANAISTLLMKLDAIKSDNIGYTKLPEHIKNISEQYNEEHSTFYDLVNFNTKDLNEENKKNFTTINDLIAQINKELNSIEENNVMDIIKKINPCLKDIALITKRKDLIKKFELENIN